MIFKEEDYLEDNGYDYYWDCSEYCMDDPDYMIEHPEITPSLFENDTEHEGGIEEIMRRN
ncbi:hypothetical protein MTBBW1_1980007 [Desulfamplus magnetovallimortis]|uniref:Uncharacterized protein n=1 Tax=Desulfamplus magnetovallimortis TaxID=1246637 RepID=A0A1W1HBL8_9BACT|nr:hypothetical protein [Desulfamplus magnetovallimortis]SLM29785.1 hypothetical protein MTBBW1_1980007 [Desulfamplus magnetovallimortis]